MATLSPIIKVGGLHSPGLFSVLNDTGQKLYVHSQLGTIRAITTVFLSILQANSIHAESSLSLSQILKNFEYNKITSRVSSRKADNLTAISEPIIKVMWDP
jgi:hypothetical protein